MATTPAAGYKVDPNNPNGVVPIDAAPTPTPSPVDSSGNFTTPSGAVVNSTTGALVTPPPGSTAPINRSIAPTDTTTDPADAYLSTFTAPKSASDIAEQKRQDAQALIDSNNKVYDDKVSASLREGQERTNQNNAISVLSGLSGSSEANRTDQAVTTANQKDVDAINNQRGAAINAIYSKISDDAATEAEQQKQDAQKSAEDIVARRKDVLTQTQGNLKLIAAGGQSFDDFKANASPEAYQHAVDAFGSEDALKASFVVNRPQNQLVGTPTRVGDHYVQAYQNPLTGKVTMESIDIPGGIPSNYSTFQKLGDNIVAIPDGWNGDTSQLKTIAGTPSQSDLLDQEYKRAQIANVNADTKKTLNELSGGGTPAGYNGEFDATIKLAANQGGTNAQREQTANTLQTFIANKDYPSAYAAISDATAKGLKGAAATTFAQQQNSLGVLDQLHQAIQAYADAGGKTNVLKGTADEIQTKIGALMTDPKFASLAVQMNAAFQNYRLQMTGAAFSPAESAEYAAILPQPGNTLDLNLAKLSGAKAYLNSSVESSIKNVVGQGGVYIKQYAEGAQPGAQQSSQPSQINYHGKVYNVDANGDMTPAQ